MRAKESGSIVEGFRYILNDHKSAVASAKYFYHPELFEEADSIAVSRHRVDGRKVSLLAD